MKITKEYLKRIIKEELEEVSSTMKYDPAASPEQKDAGFEAAKEALYNAEKTGNATLIRLLKSAVDEYRNALANMRHEKDFPM